ncbi:unnamed protein product [Arctogadus glacialis]
MEDIDAMVFVLLGLVLFVRHKREESQRRLHAARQNTLEKSRRVLEYIQQCEAEDERNQASKKRRIQMLLSSQHFH